MKILCIYSICGMSRRENVDYYCAAMDAILKQDADITCVVSGCMTTDGAKTRLKERFGDQQLLLRRPGRDPEARPILWNWIDESLPLAITVNHSALTVERSHGPFDAFLFVAADVILQSPDTVKAMSEPIFNNGAVVVCPRVDNDHGYDHWRIEWQPGQNYVVPVGSTVNGHCFLWSRKWFDAYKRPWPDIFCNHCSESVMSHMAAAIRGRFVLTWEPLVHHHGSMDGPSFGWRRQFFFAPRDMAKVYEEGKALGFGFEELPPEIATMTPRYHDPAAFDENGFARSDKLLPYLNRWLFLQPDEFHYSSVRSSLAPPITSEPRVIEPSTLTVVLPSISPALWPGIYRSLTAAATKHKWELWAIGPERGNFDAPRFRWIEDRGSPVHCLQRCLLTSRADFITWIHDDGLWLPGALDFTFNAPAIFCKYIEGSPDWNDGIWLSPPYADIARFAHGEAGLSPDMLRDAYWLMGFHEATRSPYIPLEWLMLRLGILHRQAALDVGGWDTTTFETPSMANVDLGNRLQRSGVRCILWPQVVQAIGYDPHARKSLVRVAHDEHDVPTYHGIYRDRGCENAMRIAVNPADREPAVWKRRWVE